MLVIGEKERQFTSRKIRHSDEPIEAQIIQNFLPLPEELAVREEVVKVTLALSKKSMDFFKAETGKYHTHYQRVIRKLIDSYVDTYSKPGASGSK